jgi:hypothetical protein
LKKEQISKTNPKWRWILQLAVPEVRKIQILRQSDIFSCQGWPTILFVCQFEPREPHLGQMGLVKDKE